MRARVIGADGFVEIEDPPLREAVVEARVLEVLKGAVGDGPLRFVQHGHGVPVYETGEEVVVFLRGLERSAELADSPLAGRVSLVSTQEAGAKYVLDDASRAAFASAVRRYAELDAASSAEARLAALRALTVDLLASPHAVLATSALGDLALARSVPLLTASDVPRLTGVVQSATAPIEVRIGLLAELERRGLVEAAGLWVGLLRDSADTERLAVVRAVGAHPSEAVAGELRALLADGDPFLVSEAAVALGAAGDAAVEPLAALLARPEERVRHAAIRGLGRVGTPQARAALRAAASSHADPTTRRRAGAELEALAREAPQAP